MRNVVHTVAGNVVLQKLLVIKGVPSNCVFIGVDQNAHVCPVAYVGYRQLLFAFYLTVSTDAVFDTRYRVIDECFSLPSVTCFDFLLLFFSKYFYFDWSVRVEMFAVRLQDSAFTIETSK